MLVAFLVPIALIDLDSQLIPNRLTAPGRGHRASCSAPRSTRAARSSASLAGLIGGFMVALPSLVHPAGMGLGDAKLVAVLGLFLGAAVAPAFFVAMIVGTVIGVGIIMRKGMAQGRKTKVPFGPFLALGGVVGVLAGNELLSAYLSTF